MIKIMDALNLPGGDEWKHKFCGMYGKFLEQGDLLNETRAQWMGGKRWFHTA